MKNIGLITVVQSLHVPTETQELSPGAQQGGWKEKLLLTTTKLLYAFPAGLVWAFFWRAAPEVLCISFHSVPLVLL